MWNEEDAAVQEALRRSQLESSRLESEQLQNHETWICEVCTLHNPAELNICSICESPRQNPSVTRTNETSEKHVHESKVPAPMTSSKEPKLSTPSVLRPHNSPPKDTRQSGGNRGNIGNLSEFLQQYASAPDTVRAKLSGSVSVDGRQYDLGALHTPASHMQASLEMLAVLSVSDSNADAARDGKGRMKDRSSQEGSGLARE